MWDEQEGKGGRRRTKSSGDSGVVLFSLKNRCLPVRVAMLIIVWGLKECAYNIASARMSRPSASVLSTYNKALNHES